MKGWSYYKTINHERLRIAKGWYRYISPFQGFGYNLSFSYNNLTLSGFIYQPKNGLVKIIPFRVLDTISASTYNNLILSQFYLSTQESPYKNNTLSGFWTQTQLLFRIILLLQGFIYQPKNGLVKILPFQGFRHKLSFSLE